ncbi:MAG TPA: G/U mismatch-specific DNA glycosylase [Blastocatellia bacterium]|nr:G/U mismatch-specific DNA glycosylase [Blastocatellia bacterium]
MPNRKPTKDELLAAAGRTVPDLIAPNLEVLFCGINPGLYTAAVGHHFARPGNRFWPTLHRAGFTDRLLAPSEEHELLGLGYGIASLVARATASAAELSNEEYVDGGRTLEEKVRRYRPRCVAFLGVGAYRVAFNRRQAVIGRQEERLGDSLVWVLPNPSGLNANYQLEDLTRLFRQLHLYLDETRGR